jgi:hypothetical protein
VSAPVPLPGFPESLAPLLDHQGYAAVAVLLFVEDSGVPAPGKTVPIAARGPAVLAPVKHGVAIAAPGPSSTIM